MAGLDWVKAEHDSPYGLIRSEWRRENGVFTLEVRSANTEAIIYLPVKPDEERDR